jgi:APA family basic amino acid/polyamine antiporter
MSEATSEPQSARGPAHGQLGLWDTVSIIIGIVIGSSIFTTAPTIFEGVAGPWEGLGLWLFCGVLSFVGALCYAELATTYPRYGGDYVYLTRGFDRPIGFLFGWAQLAVVLSASTGAMAFIVGDYGTALIGVNANQERTALEAAEKLYNELKSKHEKELEAAKLDPKVKVDGQRWETLLAEAKAQKAPAETALRTRQNEVALVAAQMGIGAVLVITALNFFGVVLGKWMQNGLVITKLVGLALIVIAALWSPAEAPFEVKNATRGGGGFSVSMILILYAFGGWNDAAFVAADLRDRRNIPKALLLGTVGITAIYLLVNFAYILGLGFETARFAYPNIAAHVLNKAFGATGAVIISLIVMTSALGAMNGLIYTGSRVYLSLGAEHRVFGLLGHWNATLKAPIWSLIAQALVTVAMILSVGTQAGRDSIDSGLMALGISRTGPNGQPIPAIPWGDYFGGFNTLFAGGAPVFWIFFLLTGFSMFALRARDPTIVRPFMLRAPWYPVLPLIFCAMCLFGFYAAMRYAGWISLLGFVPLLLGLPLYWLSGKETASQETAPTFGPAEAEALGPPPDAMRTDDRFKAAD